MERTIKELKPIPVLERTIKELKLNRKDAFDIEFTLIDRFSRNLHTIDLAAPRDMNTVEILVLMRHYGAPTRLLDFTYSFYVAVFFALENFRGKSPVVWGIDALWLQDQALAHLSIDETRFMPGKMEDVFKI